MEQERAEALRAELAAVSAERDRLRDALAEAGSVVEQLRSDAQAGSQVKADFMARMTHEMRTPLSAIIGLANLAHPLAVDPKLADYLALITASARGLLEVVDDITDFSQLERGQADLVSAPFDLAAVLTRVAGRLEIAARSKGLALGIGLDACVPVRLVGDGARLEAVLNHLAGNAVKFTEQGSVRLEVGLLAREDGGVRLGFCVADTGIGMEQAAVPAMLESFTQGDGSLSRPYGGTGLGLALASRGVALLGGTLAVESSPGQGTRFRFEVGFAEDATRAAARPPDACRPAAAAAAGPAIQPVLAAPGRAARPLAGCLILLVEDNPINQQVGRETLERLGAAVDVAINGREAVEMVVTAFYEVVLMDVQMPVMDGLAATRAIRALPGMADLPIVALTAHALAEDRDRCLAAGMNDYLAKPLDVAQLLTALGQWIAPAAGVAAPLAAAVSGLETGQDGAALDVDTALRRLGGNGRLLASVAAEFARDYAASADDLEGLLARGERDEARRLAHTVKGLAGTLAAQALSLAARNLEAALGGAGFPDVGNEAGLLAEFRRTLAAAVAGAASLAPLLEVAPACTGTGCWRVLLVDDAKLNRAIFSQILRSGGHEVVTAENGKDACRVLFGDKRSGRSFDLIIMDIEMPEMDGPTAARLIRGLLAASASPPCPVRVPIVALTAHDADAERQRCLEAGMDACLHKVFEQGELLAELTRIMDGPAAPVRSPAQPRPAARGELGLGLLPLLRRMAGHLAEGSIRADEDMAVVREAFVGYAAPPEAALLAEAVDRYDFARAIDILKQLAEALGLDPGAVVRRPGG
ncbi:response regulator [Solidesulfovibrio sp.]